MRIGSLFSGIGGLELGLERAGLGHVVWQCEIDPYCREVLARHWPEAKRFEDVREIDSSAPAVDILCGGFPCQDVSVAGKRAGLAGERSGLWFEFARIVRELRPRYVVVENVPGLLTGGLGDVLGELAASGYDAEWDCVPASAVGAPHRRDRVFILAYPDAAHRAGDGVSCGPTTERIGAWDARCGGNAEPGWWAAEPNVGRVADGVPRRSQRLKALGNAVVPQCAEVVGRVIARMEAA